MMVLLTKTSVALISVTILFSILFTGCAVLSDDARFPISGDGVSDADTLTVLVSILPQEEFVKQVGGEHVTVRSLIPPGASPATYDPRPSDLKMVERADIYFTIGHIPFEKTHLDTLRSYNKAMIIVDTSKDVSLIGKNDSIDPHIWLSPKQVTRQVRTIEQALIEKDPEHETSYSENADSYIESLDELDNRLDDMFEHSDTERILVFHPSWGYLARDYGFEQIAIEDEGKEPTARHMRSIVDMASEHRIRTILIQDQFDSSVAKSIAEEINATVIPVDPLAREYVQNLKNVSGVISVS
ncbi:MAG: metal ABC transporter solute-binding protein, Zn/Mn family [Nanoarchaeota archaeon]